MREQFFTTHDISAMLQVDPSTVSKWIDKEMLLAFRTPGGHRRVRTSDLRAFLTAHNMPLPDALGRAQFALLVLDDEQPALDAIRRMLKPHSSVISAATTTSGVEALLLLAESRPDGMLIDLNMPDLDGIDVLRRVREREQFAAIKLVTMTARPSSQAAQEAAAAGATACLAKPLTADALFAAFDVDAPSARRS